MKRSLLSHIAKEIINEDCWKGYEQIGMKDKGGRQVPNCVPVKEGLSNDGKFENLLGSLTKHMASKINITPLPRVTLRNNDTENAQDMLGRTAFYNHNDKAITLFTLGRHPKDILRSYAHEMIHHKQNLEGRLKNQIDTQNINEDEYLRQIEAEAYHDGNLLFREWENGLNESMVKSLSEISLMTGDADKEYSMQLFNSFARNRSNSKITKALKKLYGKAAVDSWDESERWYKDPTVANSPLDGRIQAAIKKEAIDSQGNLYITALNDYSYTIHTLWKLDEPAKTAYVGEIKTTTSKGKYSMRRAYGVDAKVVHWSNLAQEYKGAGYGKFLYDTLLYYYGTLESDSTLYQGSQKMWMNHMPRVAKLFCYTVKHPDSWGGGSEEGEQLIVLPADERDVADRGFVSNIVGSFVAFHREIPPTVAKLARFAKGLNFREGTLNIAYINYKLNEKIDRLDPFERDTGSYDGEDSDYMVKSGESFLDFMEDISFQDLINALDSMDDVYTYTTIQKARKLILSFEDATVLVTPAGSKIKYELL
jgi:hypothetical protein